MLYSIAKKDKANGLIPFDYIVHYLEQLSDGQVDIEKLLPWNVKLNSVWISGRLLFIPFTLCALHMTLIIYFNTRINFQACCIANEYPINTNINIINITNSGIK